MDRILFNRLGRSLEFEPGSPEAPGAAVEVPALVAATIQGDESLAPHFRVEAIQPVTRLAERELRKKPVPDGAP